MRFSPERRRIASTAIQCRAKRSVGLLGQKHRYPRKSAHVNTTTELQSTLQQGEANATIPFGNLRKNQISSDIEIDHCIQVERILEALGEALYAKGLSPRYKAYQIGEPFSKDFKFLCVSLEPGKAFDFVVLFFGMRLGCVQHSETLVCYDGEWRDQTGKGTAPEAEGIPPKTELAIEIVWHVLEKNCGSIAWRGEP